MRWGIIILALAVMGVFVARRHLGEFLAGQLDTALTAEGIFIKWESADWVPGGGLRLHGLALYRDAARHDRLARFGLVTARRPEPAFLRWDKINFKTEDTQLVLGSGAEETKFEHLNMLFRVLPGLLDLPVCDASLPGLRIEFQWALATEPPTGTTEEIANAQHVTQNEGLFRDSSLAWLKPTMERLKFQAEKDEPVLKIHLHSPRDDGGQNLTLTFEGKKFVWQRLKWDSVHGEVTIPLGRKNSPIEIEQMHIGYAGRMAEIAGSFDPVCRVFRMSKMDSGIDLLALARAYEPALIEKLPAIHINGGWQIRGAGEIPLDHPENIQWHGEAAFEGDFVYASGPINIALQKPAFSLRFAKQTFTISDFKGGVWDGKLKAPKTVIYLPSLKKNLRFETQFTLADTHAQSLLRSFQAQGNSGDPLPWDWQGTWQMSGTGEIPLNHPENTQWRADAALNGDFIYTKGPATIPLKKPTFSVHGEDQVIAITNFKTGLWDGSLQLPKTLIYPPSGKKPRRFVTQVALKDARLQSIINSFGSTLTEPGIVQGTWTGGGEFDPATFAGSGALSIDEAKFGRMPILGSLRFVFRKLIPKFSQDETSSMNVDHRISGGTLFLNDMKLVGQRVQVKASGTIDLANENTRFAATARLRRLPGIATFLLTSRMEFNGEGPVDDVHWSLKRNSIWRSINKAITTPPKTDAERATDKALKELLQLPGDLLRVE